MSSSWVTQTHRVRSFSITTTPRKQVEDEENTKEDAWVPGEMAGNVGGRLILINDHP